MITLKNIKNRITKENFIKAIRKPSLALKVMYVIGSSFFIKNKRDPEAKRLMSWGYGKIKREDITSIFPGIEKVEVIVSNCFERDFGMSIDTLEILYLNAITKFMKPKKIIEIGTYDGNTILNLAANTDKDSSLTTLDLPPDWEGNLKIPISNSMYNVSNRQKIGYQINSSKYKDKIKQIYGDSASIDWDNLGGPFDLIFIDGCHHYEYVKSDTNNAIKHLHKDGIIIWHDYGMKRDVSKVVDQYQDLMKIHVIRGTRLAVGFVKKKMVFKSNKDTQVQLIRANLKC